MKIRRLISLTTFIAFIFLAFSGIMLFFSPQGRVAYWAGWEIFGLSKEEYTAVHTTFMLLFLTVGVWHIVLNWKPIVGYLKDRSKKVRITRPEFLASLAICLLFFVGPLTRIPPFGQLLDAGEAVKAYWERTHGSPPWGHAEESTLERFCSRIGGFQRSAEGGALMVDCQEAMAALVAAGITIEAPSQRIIDIARANGVTPQAVADVVLSVAEPAEPGSEARGGQGSGAGRVEGGRFPHPGSGMGRITLREYSARFDLDLNEILTILEQRGMEIGPDERLRDAATRLGTDPVGILEALNEG
jgi:hypothetical protein